MQIARVRKHIVATRKHEAYRGKKLLLVEPVDRDDAPAGDPILAVDLVDAGVNDLVLVSSEGRFARELFGASSPVRSTVIAIVEGIDFDLPT